MREGLKVCKHSGCCGRLGQDRVRLYDGMLAQWLAASNVTNERKTDGLLADMSRIVPGR